MRKPLVMDENFKPSDPLGLLKSDGERSPLTERPADRPRETASVDASDRVARAHETSEASRPERMAQPEPVRAPEPSPATPQQSAEQAAPTAPQPARAAQPSTNPAAYARDRLISVHGMSPHAAAAIAGHGQAESRFQLDAIGDNGTSVGGWQWRNERALALRDFARSQGKDWRNLDVQVDFLAHELKTTEGRAARALAEARNVDEATVAFMHFERPRGYTPDNPTGGHNMAGRLNYARALVQEPSAAPQSAGVGAIENAIGIRQPGAVALEDSSLADRVAHGDGEARARGQGGDATGIGLARLASPEPEAANAPVEPGFSGALNFVNPGQDRIDPQFASILTDTSAAMGQPFTINSGYRSPSHSVEAAKIRRGGQPGEHARGTASDISMRGMSTAQRQQLVRELQSRGVRRFGTYSNSPDMLHVDMRDQSGNNTAWFMHDRSNGNMGRAPSWFKDLSGQMHRKPVGDRATASRERNTQPIVMDDNFKPADPMGIFGNRQAAAQEQAAPEAARGRPHYGVLEPLAPGEFIDNGDGSISTARTETIRDADGKWVNVPTIWKDADGNVRDLAGDEAGMRRALRDADEFGDRPLPRYASLRRAEMAAETHSAAGGGMAGTGFDAPGYSDRQISQRIAGEDVTAEDPGIIDAGGGMLEMDRSDYADWRRQWEAEQPGMVEDLSRLFGGSLVAGVGHFVRGLGATYVANGRFATEYVLNPIFGTNVGIRNPTERTAEGIVEIGEGVKDGVSVATQDAIERSTPDGDLLRPSTWTLGEDPSLEGYTALTLDVMGSFAPVLLAGLLGGPAAGLVVGGGQGGGAAEQEAQEIIDSMAKNGVLEQESAYYRQQIAAGASPEEALERTKQAAGQVAHLIVTPISSFGGYATSKIVDPATQILAGRGLLARITGRAALGALEEGAQEAAEQVGTRAGTNIGAGTDVDLTEGTFGDFMLGALGGAVPGGIAGGFSRRDGSPASDVDATDDQGQPDAVAPQTTPSAPSAEAEPQRPRGSLGRAVDAAQRRAEDRALGADPTRPRPRSTVQVLGPDGNPFMATVESIEGDEVVVFDSASGEIYQVPAANVSAELAPPPGEASLPRPEPIVETPPVRESVPATQDPTGTEFDGETLADPNDPALEPSLPTPTETTTEMPPASEQERVTDRPQGRPRPGARVIVDAPGVGRFSGRLTRYEGEESVVVDDNGRSYQVPNSALTVSKLTRDQVDAQEAKRNPPVARERSSGPTIRDVRGAQIEMPDPMHAALYDLGRMRQESKKLLGARQLELDNVSPAEQARLAEEWGLSPAALGQIADDYRFRVERAAKKARSGLPQKVQPVNPKMIARFRSQAAGAETDVDIEMGIHEAATSPNNSLPEPTDAQKEAGNYKVGRLRLNGLDISIENPAGSTRSGKDAAGKAWSNEMKSHYGYFRGTVGRDKDHIDTFVKPGTVELADHAPVFVIDQVDPDTRRFDEHKVMTGFANADEAVAAYRDNYAADWNGMGDVTETTLGDLKQWFKTGRTSEPFASRAPATGKESLQVAAPAAETVTEPVTPAAKAEPATTPRPATKPKTKAKAAPYLDRLQNWFRPGRVISGTYGTDRVIDFTRGLNGQWNVRVIATDAEGNALPREQERTHQTAPDRRELDRWERDNPVGSAATAPAAETMKPETEDDVLKRMGERHSVKGFLEMLVTKPRAQVAAVIDQKGRIWEITGSSDLDVNPNAGAHGHLFAELHGANLFPDWPVDKNLPYAKISRYGTQLGIDSGELNQPQKTAAKALMAAAEREGVSVVTSFPFDREMGTAAAPASTDDRFAGNTLFTADKVAAARARLKSKMSQLNSGIDPEVLIDGMTIAGAYIEAGVRDFSHYARQMADDFGDGIRPFLLSFWEATRHYPGLDTTGMTPPEESARLHAAMTAEPDSANVPVQSEDQADGGTQELDQAGAGSLEGAPADAVPGTGEGRQARAGARDSGGADLFGDRPARGRRDGPRDGVADGARTVSPAAPRGDGAGRADTVQPDPDGDRGTAREDRDAALAPGSVDASQSAATPAQDRAADIGFTITDADQIGTGGQKTKFKNNIAAVRLLRTLEEENRPATASEQRVLAKWVGWGGLPQAFYRDGETASKGWDKEAAQLKELLTDEEYAAARASTQNAHYTPPEVVKAVWSIAERLGFRGGQVLEPSVGAGNFLGLMPAGARKGSRITGVELDHITGGIARNLYPAANIQAPKGFQDVAMPDGYFDLAIGNPPFGSTQIYDGDRRHLNRMSIHNYFFAKSLDTLKPNGVLAMVVTNYFLDSTRSRAKDYIASKADLVAAIRLPNDAFLENAGTEVTTDIVILRKRAEEEGPGDTRWTEVGTHTDAEGREVSLSRYFLDNPDMMLGEFGAYGTMYRGQTAALVSREGQNTAALLDAVIAKLPEDIMPPPSEIRTETITVPREASDALVGSSFLDADGNVWTRTDDSLGQPQAERVELSGKSLERVAGMVRVRDAFARLRRAQIDANASDAKIENLRSLLNKAYDGFVKRHGPINLDANKRLFRDDPTWPQLSALENDFDKGLSVAVAKKTGEKAREPSAKKAPIFTERTQQPYQRPTRASSAKDALAQTLADLGRVDLPAMAKLYGKGEDAILDELGALVYRDPAGHWETAEGYLSGNVRQKLAAAQRAAEQDPAFRRNVAALEDVQPADIEAVDIEVKPGSPWVPANHVADFANHITNGRGAKATYYSTLARWDIDAGRGDDSAQLQWGTDRATVGAVLDAALNDRTITITNRMSDGSRPVDVAATEAANEKVARVKDEWRRWLWQDDTRRAELSRLYNDTFNTDVLRVYDGAHLALPGKVGDYIIELRPHQKSFVWRAMQSGTVLGDHTVGAGKTFAAIAAVMEKRRIGQWKKPAVVVPNHLVGQWAADFIKLYPGARILAATKKDFEKANRKRFFARMATGDWDAVIVAHSSFGRIGVDQATQEAFITEQIDEIDAAIDALRNETGKDGRSVKQVEAQRDRLKEKLKALYDQDGKDDGLTFDEIGIDGIVVDEAHEFKNLGFATSMTRVAGLGNPQGSQKASDLHMKIRVVKQRTGGQNVMFLTGTPISNTMAEMFTVQRYLDEESLKAMGIAHFDAWARVFGEVVTDWELSPAGKYQMKSRFSRFANIPELMTRYRSFADVISNDDIKRQLAERGQTLPLPKVKGGKPENVVVERSAEQAAFIGEPDEEGNYPPGSLVWRAENLPKKVEKGSDNMLKVMSDARKAALDMRLIDPAYPDNPNSKVHQAADRMKALYDRWHAQKGTQLVFIDLSTPKAQKGKEAEKLRALIAKAESGDEAAQEAIDKMSPDEFDVLDGGDFSVYDDLRQKLIDRGIPSEEIAFIHDANTDLQKEELFGKVRSGRVRFLFGSTPKMGAGTNVQARLVGLHHLDAPWRPSDLEQREGRIIRQGNELYAQDPEGFEVEINRYATKLTLDSRMWQTIEQKARFIGQIRAGSTGERVIEDIGGEAANAAEMKAAASGNPLILEEMDLRQKLRKLDGQSREHDREQFRIADRIRTLGDEQERTTARLPAMQSESNMAFEALNANTVTVAGAQFDKPKEIGDAILKAMSDMVDADAGSIDDLGSFGGFALSATHNFERNATLVVKGEFEHEIEVLDIREQDAVGLGMKLRNTVRSLVDAPLGAESRLEQIGPQMEKLEAQRGEFGQAEELFQVRQRHQAVLDQLKPKKQEAAPAQPATDEAGDPSIGWDSVDGGPESNTGPTEADIDQVRTIIQQVAGLDDVAFVDTITMPEGAPGWGLTAPVTASGMYQAARDVITIALDSSSDRTAYHESFHRLQHLFLTDAERAVLRAERGKLRRMVRADKFRRSQVDGMSQSEIEAEAFAIYAAGKGRIRPHRTLAALWDRIRRTLDRARSYLAGRGFQTVEDIYDAARAGRIADRQAINVQTSRLPAEFMARPVLRLTGQELGVPFTGPQDMPALRKAARAYYDANLRGSTVTTANGLEVQFNTRGAKKTVSGNKGDILLRAVPAIRSILENGRIVHREPGNVERIRERIVIAAPVELDGKVHPLAVSIHETTDGTFQYDFTFDRNAGGEFTVDVRPEVEPGGPGRTAPLPSLEVPLQHADGDLNIGFWPAEGNETSYNVNPPTSPTAIAKNESRLKQEIKGKLTDIQPSTLSLVPLNYFTELKQDNMTAVDDYLGMKRALDAYRGKQHAKSDAVAQTWLKYVRAGVSDKGKAKAAELAGIMHDATLAGVDPAKTDPDSVNHPSYAALRARYMKLAPAGRALFGEVRDTYRKQQLELDAIILDNVRKATEIAQKRADEQMQREIDKINRSKLNDRAKKDAIADAKKANSEARTKAQWSMKARLTRLRQTFEASRVPAPYFPLGRFGRYYVVAKDVNGEVLSFSKRETAADRDRLANQLRRDNPTAEITEGVMDEMTSAREAMDPRLVAEVEKIVGGLGIDASSMAGVLDQIWQRYLETMPDLSIRKRYIHRKGIAGFDEDALRVFSSHMFHAAHQMGRLKYGMELNELVNDIARQGREAENSTKGVTLANEMRKRHDWVMNPSGTRAAQTVNSLAFVWYLGLTPAAALVNMSQTPIMGIPVLAGRFGSFPKAAAALLKASKDSVMGRGLPSNAKLPADEQRAMEAFYNTGLVDRTQSHDLAGVGDTGVDYGPLKARVMEVISFMFHRAEVWNREVTALAAYRMAKAAGQDWTQAVNTAHDLTWKTHFDYSNSSRPRVMQNDFAKVALVFRAHSINMLYRLGRDTHQAFAGATPQARREARTQLAGIYGMMAVSAGVTGVPAFNLAMMILGMLFGDDDDPFDFEARFKQSMLDTLGPDLGGVVLNGAPGHLTGTDLTARIGMPDLWFRSPNRDLEGKEQFEYYLFNLLGASTSLAGSMFRGVTDIAGGDVQRGIENMVPKWARDLMRTQRYATEGLTSFQGDEILPAEDFAMLDLVNQAIGFTPARVSEAWQRSSDLKNAERRIYDRRQKLIAQYALAQNVGDRETMQRVLERIHAFNAVPLHRATRITPQTLKRSLKARASVRARRQDGVNFRNEDMGRQLVNELSERVY